MSTLEKENNYKDEHFDFIQKHVRKFCLRCILSKFTIKVLPQLAVCIDHHHIHFVCTKKFVLTFVSLSHQSDLPRLSVCTGFVMKFLFHCSLSRHFPSILTTLPRYVLSDPTLFLCPTNFVLVHYSLLRLRPDIFSVSLLF